MDVTLRSWSCDHLIQVIRKLLTESGTLIYMGMPAADAPEDETMLALHPGIDPQSL